MRASCVCRRGWGGEQRRLTRRQRTLHLQLQYSARHQLCEEADDMVLRLQLHHLLPHRCRRGAQSSGSGERRSGRRGGAPRGGGAWRQGTHQEVDREKLYLLMTMLARRPGGTGTNRRPNGSQGSGDGAKTRPAASFGRPVCRS